MAFPEAKQLPPGIRPRCRENTLVASERFFTVSKETGVSPQEGEQMLKDNIAGIFSKWRSADISVPTGVTGDSGQRVKPCWGTESLGLLTQLRSDQGPVTDSGRWDGAHGHNSCPRITSRQKRREETARQCCLAPYPVHMLNVCLESQCHQVLPKNTRTLSNINHAPDGTTYVRSRWDGISDGSRL